MEVTKTQLWLSLAVMPTDTNAKPRTSWHTEAQQPRLVQPLQSPRMLVVVANYGGMKLYYLVNRTALSRAIPVRRHHPLALEEVSSARTESD